MSFLERIFGIPDPPIPSAARMQPRVWKFPNDRHRDQDGYYPIVCPYCLESFHIWEAEFRSVAPDINEAAPIDMENIQNQPIQDDRFGRSGRQKHQNVASEPVRSRPAAQLNPELDNSTGFPREIDEKYEKFQMQIGGETGSFLGKVLRIFDENGEPTGEVTHISLMDRQHGGLDKDNIRVPVQGHTKKDFERRPIMSVVNKYGEMCDERICPHCHHGVSDNVGIWPIYTVALIGDTYVGKTVYLGKLGAALTSKGLLGGRLVGLEANLNNKSLIRRAIEMDERALTSTDALTSMTTMQFMPPNSINFSYTDSTAGGFILNLFDFPGEALSRPIGGVDITKKFRAQYLSKIERVDGWMLMFDSISFETVRSEFEKDEDMRHFLSDRSDSIKPLELLNFFEIEYLKMHANKFNKPLAVIMSKSDLIKYGEWVHKEYFPTLAQTQTFLDPNPNEGRDKVDLDDIYMCNKELEAFLSYSQDDSVLYKKCSERDQINKESCWFAVSSMGDPSQGMASPIRITEPMEWLLWRMGLVEGQGKWIPGGGKPEQVG